MAKKRGRRRGIGTHGNAGAGEIGEDYA